MSVAMDQRPVPSGGQQHQYPQQYPPQPQHQNHQQQHQQQQEPTQRPRPKSTFSFKSDKSGGQHSHSHSASAKHDRTASWESKHKSHLHPATKADPNAAMEEQQPIAAALEKPTLQSLRSFSHTDSNGNPIAEPDLSNPTRSRWERPLDTIRSFEAAIDGEYRRRSNVVRGGGGEGTEVMSNYGSRRSSYYGGGGHDQNRYSQVSGYYGNRQNGRDSYADPGHGVGGPVGGPPRTRNNRMQSDPAWNRYNQGNGVYPNQGYQQSRDTVNTNGSNGSHSDPYTEPGSDNSSVERAVPATRPDGEQYGFQGFGGGPILEEYPAPQNMGYAVQQPNGAHAYNGQNGYGAPPPVPAKAQPIKLGQSSGGPPAEGRPNVLQRQNTDKRRSWFKRRFSKD